MYLSQMFIVTSSPSSCPTKNKNHKFYKNIHSVQEHDVYQCAPRTFSFMARIIRSFLKMATKSMKRSTQCLDIRKMSNNTALQSNCFMRRFKNLYDVNQTKIWLLEKILMKFCCTPLVYQHMRNVILFIIFGVYQRNIISHYYYNNLFEQYSYPSFTEHLSAVNNKSFLSHKMHDFYTDFKCIRVTTITWRSTIRLLPDVIFVSHLCLFNDELSVEQHKATHNGQTKIHMSLRQNKQLF